MKMEVVEIRTKLGLFELPVMTPEKLSEHVEQRRTGIVDVEIFKATRQATPKHQEACQANGEYERLVRQVVKYYQEQETVNGPKITEINGLITDVTTKLTTATNALKPAEKLLRDEVTD